LSELKIRDPYIYSIETIFENIRNDILEEDAVEYIKDRRNFISKMYMDFLKSDNKIGLFNAVTGVGKTAISVKWSNEIVRLVGGINSYAIFAKQYENGVNNIIELIERHIRNPVEYILFEGKYRSCPIKEYLINKDGLTVGKLLTSGHPITYICESETKDKDGTLCKDDCIYYQRCNKILTPVRDGGTKRIITVSHELDKIMKVFLARLTDTDSIFVIDEDFFSCIKIQSKIYLRTVNTHLKSLRYILSNYGKKDRTFELAQDLFDLYSEFRDSFKNKEINYDKVEEIISNIYAFYKGEPGKLSEHISKLIIGQKIKNFSSTLGVIFSLSSNYGYMEEIELENNTPESSIKWFNQAIKFYPNPTKKDRISIVFYNKFMLAYLLFHEHIRKIIINDATGNIRLLESLFNTKDITVYPDQWKRYRNINFIQFFAKSPKEGRKYALYHKQSLLNERTLKRLLGYIKKIAKKHKDEKILVVSMRIDWREFNFFEALAQEKTIKDYVEGLGENIFWCYYPLEATNKYEDFNICVLLGKPNMPPEAYERESVLLGIDMEEYEVIWCRSAMKQAFGRIMRGSDEKFVYIISGFNLGIEDEDAEIIKIYGHRQFDRYFEIGNEMHVIESYVKKSDKNIVTASLYMDLFKCNKRYALMRLKKLEENDFLIRVYVDLGKRGRPFYAYALR